MNEHGWPDHDDDPHGYHDPGLHDPGLHDPGLHDSGLDDSGLPEPDLMPGPDVDDFPDDDPFEVPAEDPVAAPAFEPPAEAPPAPGWEATDLGLVGADPDAAAAGDDPVNVFPPAVDVGPLPEPVDGFPWIDTGSLGLVDPAAVHIPADPVTPQDLAEYAAADLPPGVDPWAALAGSDDPATAALARWWSEHGH